MHNLSSFNLDRAGDFDGGIGCIIRGNPASFRDSDVILDNVDPLESTFACQENEELVGNIIKLSGRGDAELKVRHLLLWYIFIFYLF